jgi:hypothetical protein
MRGAELQRRARRLAVAVTLLATVAGAAEPIDLRPEGDESFGADTPIGRVAYGLGRGLRLGDSGLHIGGFATAEAERLEDGSSFGGLEGVNFLLSFDPSPYFHAFSEIELGRILEADDEHTGASSDPELEIERLYGDFGTADALNLRAGKFLTPFGRWNQAPHEPFVWTTSEPLIVEEVFDESVTGAMVWGSVFPEAVPLSYSLYGQFVDPLDADPDPPPADRSAGARLELGDATRWTAAASYFATKRPESDWHHLGGIDALWRPVPRLELSMEALAGEGAFEGGGQWGIFAQGVWELVPTVHLVGRYEHFDPPAGERAVDLYIAGFAWDPAPFLRLKADYRFANHLDERAAPGVRASFSVLF